MDEDELKRFVEAVALGQIADQEFAEECAACRAAPGAGSSPLDALADLERPFVYGRMHA